MVRFRSLFPGTWAGPRDWRHFSKSKARIICTKDRGNYCDSRMAECRRVASPFTAPRFAHRPCRRGRLVSICSGVFVLVATGLLDGKRATTHWHHVDRLIQMYPKIRVEPDVLYVDEGNILSSAGSAAGIDLCLHIVRLDYGAEVANEVARRLVMPAHCEGGQAQYVRDSRCGGRRLVSGNAMGRISPTRNLTSRGSCEESSHVATKLCPTFSAANWNHPTPVVNASTADLRAAAPGEDGRQH
jgi:DJ-1/PfpI family